MSEIGFYSDDENYRIGDGPAEIEKHYLILPTDLETLEKAKEEIEGNISERLS